MMDLGSWILTGPNTPTPYGSNFSSCCSSKKPGQAMLVARLTETSLGRLEVCTVDGYGRCIQTLEKFAVGELLAKEKPLVLGSSDGLSLAEVCCLSGGDVTVDASDSGVISNTLPETNIAPENRVSPIFRGYVRFGEGIFKLFLLFTPKPLWFPDSPSFQTKKTHQKSGDDLIAACVLLERRKEKSEHDAEVRCAVAAELDRSDENSSNSLDPLIPYLSSEVNETLEHDSGSSGVLNAMLRKWRGICDVNAETWVELIESSGNVRFLFGLFGALAMAEHSCDPNARVEWDQKEQTMRLVATKAIDAKQRVSRSYLDVGALLSSSSLRQDALQNDWHFTCRCTRCQDEYQTKCHIGRPSSYRCSLAFSLGKGGFTTRGICRRSSLGQGVEDGSKDGCCRLCGRGPSHGGNATVPPTAGGQRGCLGRRGYPPAGVAPALPGSAGSFTEEM